jgi:hypothetical protein
MSNELITVSGLSQKYRMDRRTIQRRLADLEPERTEKRAGKTVRLYRLRACVPLLLEKNEQQKLAQLMERLHGARAEKLEIENGLRDGELVDLEAVSFEFQERILVMRTHLLSLPHRVAPLIASINSNPAASEEHKREARRKLIQDEVDYIVADLERPFSWQRKN